MLKLKYFISLVFLLSFYRVTAQEVGQLSDPKCTSIMTQRRGDVSYNYVYFNVHGINLSKYDWSDPTTNCNINLAVHYNKKRAIHNYIGYGLIAIGGLFIAAEASCWGNCGENVAPAVLFTGAGVASFVLGISNKRKANIRIGNVADYYSKNKL